MKNNSKICPHCKMNMREKWLKLHLEQGMPITEVAKLAGFHQDTLYIWKRNYLEKGIEGLMDKSRAPHNHPNEYSEEIKERIKFLRKEGRGIGPDIIRLRLKKRFDLEISRSGIAGFLNRKGLVNEKLSRRIKNKKQRIRKCKIHEPGELNQIDIKYAVKSLANYWFYQYSAIDWLTGIAYGNIYELESNFESVLFLKSLVGFYPFKIKGVQTDNASVFTNRYTGYLKSSDPMNPRLHAFDLLCKELDINHYLIDPGKPAQNGKVERFHRTCEQEFYQRETFKDLNSLRKKFRDFLHYYNNEREHLGLNGLTPLEKLQTLPNYEKIKEIA
jgi:transposase InsO family protein